MRFEDYMANNSNQSPSDWLDLSTLPLSSGVLGIFDLVVLGNDIKAKIELPAGDYLVQAKIVVKNEQHHVSVLRVISGSPGERSMQVADVNIDCPQIAIAEYQACLDTTNFMDEYDEQDWISHVHPHQLAGTAHITIPQDLKLAFAQPGLGDGIYPVYQLLQEGVVVGLEMEFLNEMGHPPRAYAARFHAEFPAFAALLASGKAEPVQDMEQPALDTEIAEAEKEIGVPLPRSYQNFLKLSAGVSLSCGSIVFGTSHLYFHEFEPFEHLPHHHQAELMHHDRRWPPPSEGFLCFADFWMESEGDQALFDVKKGLIDGEYPVVYYNYEQDAVSPLASNFADWLERIVAGAATKI